MDFVVGNIRQIAGEVQKTNRGHQGRCEVEDIGTLLNAAMYVRIDFLAAEGFVGVADRLPQIVERGAQGGDGTQDFVNGVIELEG